MRNIVKNSWILKFISYHSFISHNAKRGRGSTENPPVWYQMEWDQLISY